MPCLVDKANSFLDGFDCAKGRKNLWVADCVPGIIGIFLVELTRAGLGPIRAVLSTSSDGLRAGLSPTISGQHLVCCPG